jgi:hypothetical protein
MLKQTQRSSATVLRVAVLTLALVCGLETHAQDLSAPSRIELGLEFSTLTLGPSFSSFPAGDFTALPASHWEPGFGGRFTLNLTKYLALDSESNFFPRRLSPGGHAVQGQFGIKAGHRFNRIGVFAKVRPGFVSFSQVPTEEGTETIGLSPLQFTVPHIVTRRRSFPSIDIGGVFEIYLSRRILARLDGGDTIIRYGRGIFFDLDENTPQFPAQTKHNFQFSAGVGFRF